MTNYAASFGAKNVQKATFEAAEVMLGPWNQQLTFYQEGALSFRWDGQFARKFCEL